jgi:hypothetical protein
MRANLRNSGGGGCVCPEVIVEAPRAHLLAKHEHFGGVSAIPAMRHHAVEAGESMRDDGPLALAIARRDERPPSIDKNRRGSKSLAGPDTLAFDLRIVSEGAAGRCRQSQIEGVAEVITGET